MKDFSIKKTEIFIYSVIAFIVVILDQLTKIYVNGHLMLNVRNEIIPGFFNFTYLHNSGAAWGMFEGRLNMFYIISVLATIFIVHYFVTSKPYQWITRVGLISVFAGMVGNLIDRISLGYVRDFLDFIIIGYDFPVFNVADIAITVGVGLVLLELLIEEYKQWKISKS